VFGFHLDLKNNASDTLDPTRPAPRREPNCTCTLHAARSRKPATLVVRSISVLISPGRAQTANPRPHRETRREAPTDPKAREVLSRTAATGKPASRTLAEIETTRAQIPESPPPTRCSPWQRSSPPRKEQTLWATSTTPVNQRTPSRPGPARASINRGQEANYRQNQRAIVTPKHDTAPRATVPRSGPRPAPRPFPARTRKGRHPNLTLTPSKISHRSSRARRSGARNKLTPGPIKYTNAPDDARTASRHAPSCASRDRPRVHFRQMSASG
jgi:hypothetical protein